VVKNDVCFDAAREIEAIKTKLQKAKRRNYSKGKSKLDKYTGELIAMRQAGASFTVLAEWLSVRHRVKITRMSICRFLRARE
jgi:hypothetical protein